MFLEKKKGITSLVLAGCLLFTTEFEVLAANPQSEAQAIETMNYETQTSVLASAWDMLPEMASLAADTQEWQGKALASTDNYLEVYTEASEESTVLGRMYSNTVAVIEEEGETWTKISSGKVTGYVKSESLLTGIDAVERAEETCANGTSEARTLEDIESEKLLAAIIFCEAGNQPYAGKVAVGAVVLNRVESGRFPNTIREVIYQRGQFTPAMTGKLARVLASGNIPGSCYEAARDALNGESPVGNALFFNTGHGSFKLGDHYFS